jgi:hypothetical protein
MVSVFLLKYHYHTAVGTCTLGLLFGRATEKVSSLDPVLSHCHCELFSRSCVWEGQ